jgi:hypothetical protein
MKVTVDLSESEIADICELAGTSKKGPAIRQILSDALSLRRRATIAEKFLTCEWSAECEGLEASRVTERQSAKTLSEKWRD